VVSHAEINFSAALKSIEHVRGAASARREEPMTFAHFIQQAVAMSKPAKWLKDLTPGHSRILIPVMRLNGLSRWQPWQLQRRIPEFARLESFWHV
jgi:hypothetical protein